MVQMLIEKKCGRCGLVKSFSDFGINNAKRDGLQTSCRDCKRDFQNRWYHENKARHVINVVRQRKERVATLRLRVYAHLKEHPCVECGEAELLMLEFDHVRGEKRGTISVMVTACFSWKVIALEIAKCEVRCVRCHRRKTATQLGWHLP